jgi:hypothetical protein
MGQIGYGLYRSFESLTPYLIEEQGKNNRRGKTKEQVIKTDEKGVPQKPDEVGAVEKADKVFKPHPFAVRESPTRGKILKSDKGPIYGFVTEKGVKYHHRQHQKIEGPVPFHISAEGIRVCFHCNAPKNLPVRKPEGCPEFFGTFPAGAL